MGTGILIGLAVVVVVIILYIIAKMDDRLTKANSSVRGANFTIDAQKHEIADLNASIKFYRQEANKAEMKYQMLKAYYDKLLNDYHELEQEISEETRNIIAGNGENKK